MDLLRQIEERVLPFGKLLGIRYVSATKERIVAELTVRDELSTRHGTVHGGCLMAFADTLGATGTIVNLPEGGRTTTMESKTNFIASAPVGATLVGEATPIHRGKRTQIWQTRISTQDGKLVALVTQTQMVLG
jgi:1,4-dihydroxy-2-naphthoyl-CoA hydrolase